MRYVRSPIVALGLLVVWALLCAPICTAEVTDDQVADAITRMKKYFFDQQDPETGSWEFRSKTHGLVQYALQAGGETALVTQALLVSGESFQNPRVSRAIEFLQQKSVKVETPGVAGSYDLELFKGAYAVAVRAHVWSYLPPQYLYLLESDAAWLLDMASKHPMNLFDYTHAAAKSQSRVDHSVSQYGLLGLWQASKRGIRVPRRYWESWVKHFIEAQLQDGGWNYGSDALDQVSSGGMTAAGLTALHVGQQELYRKRHNPEPKLTESLDTGMRWLQENFNGKINPRTGGEAFGAYDYYYTYCIERVALMSGTRYLNNQDWFQRCARDLLKSINKEGNIDNDYYKTGFALMFLARGRYPVWINKLKVPGQNWRNHPNDLYFLTHYLSDQREGEINWQVVSVDTDPAEWLVAPVAFLSSDNAVNLTGKQKKSIKRYLDLGGLLVTSPDSRSRSFTQSIRALADELYPQYGVKPMTGDHPLFHAWHRLPKTAGQQVYSVSNGARELIIMADTDWGYAFQSEEEPGKSAPWKLMTNIFAYASDKGVLNNRLVMPFERRKPGGNTERMVVGRPRYDGNWLPEPGAWSVLSDAIYNKTGITVLPTPEREGETDAPDEAEGEEPTGLIGTTQETPEELKSVLSLDQIGESDLKLIHLTGTDSITLTEDQVAAIRKYVGRGGTIIVETVGGQGDFSQEIERQLKDHFNGPAIRLTGYDPVISGHGLQGGYDNRRAAHRRYAVLKLMLEPRPNLFAFMVDEKPAIIFSHDDISLGALGARHWSIIGYQPESSRKIMTNIVLWALQQHIKPAE